MTDRICAAQGCSRRQECPPWCGMHYKRVRRHGDPAIVLRRTARVGCRVAGCESAHYAFGLCKRHARRLWRMRSTTSSALPLRLRCRICDEPDMAHAFDPDRSTRSMAVEMGITESVVRKHKAHHDDHDWHTKRAAWWVNELEMVHQMLDREAGS